MPWQERGSTGALFLTAPAQLRSMSLTFPVTTASAWGTPGCELLRPSELSSGATLSSSRPLANPTFPLEATQGWVSGVRCATSAHFLPPALAPTPPLSYLALWLRDR